LLCGCLAPSVGEDPSLRRVAVVSLAISNWRGVGITGLFSWFGAESIVQDEANKLLRISEAELGRRWQVVPARTFIDNPAFLTQATDAEFRIFTPMVEGRPLPVFTTRIDELLKGRIDSERAKALCSALRVDAVVVVFTDWTTRTGYYVRSTKAVTKTIVTIWDAQGVMRSSQRLDLMGKSAIGNRLFYEVNEQTVQDWTTIYTESFSAIVNAL
jgi:hypothetical protein